MEGILKDAQRPLQRGEFVLELEKRGFAIPSEDKARYLGTILWRQRERFVNIPKAGYWLRDVPCLAANYKPGDIVEARFGMSEDSTGYLIDLREQRRP